MIKGNEGGKVKASYKIERAAGGTSHAEPLEFGVGVALDLKEPKIKEAPNDSTLDPLAAQSALTAVINYDDMQVGDNITASWHGAHGTLPAGSHTTDPWPVTTVGPQEIPLAVSVIAFNLAKRITLDYSVTRGTQEPKDSRTRTLGVFQLSVDLSHSPKIIQAAGGGDGTELDVSTLTAAATLRSGFWPHIASGQRVWMRVEGTKKDDKAYIRNVWTGPSNAVNGSWISNGYLDVSLALADLQSLKDLSPLNVFFMATPDRSTDENLALSFPVRTYTVKNVVEVLPTIESIKESPGGDEIPHGSPTVKTAVTLSGKATPGKKIDLANNGVVMPNTEIQVDSEGEWTFQLTGLVAGNTYKLSARRKDGTLSDARDVVVVALVVPTLTSVKGSPSGVEIPQAGVTVETAVTLSGVAAKGQKVEIFDGAVSKGPATADPTTGVWTLLVSALAVAAHSFTAKALYGSGAASAARTLTVTAATAPTLTSVKGSPSGVEIPQAGVTVETAVTLSGVAAKGQKVEIFDGTVSKGQATANATTGVWTLLISALAVAAHSFTAMALYGSGATSAARTLTVTAATAPTLTSVKGSPSGVEIPQGGVTVETAVTLSGVAAKGQKVEIFDGTVSKGQATAHATTGVWTLLVSALAVAAHSFTAKALYVSNPVSAARTFTVAVATAPTIASVKGTLSGREIPKGGTTAELAVTLSGIAAKGLKVEVFDHTMSQGEATADGATGVWTFDVRGLGRVEHSFKVKAVYGTRPESAPWNFTVLKAIQIPQGRLLIGQSISTETCRITFLTQSQVNCYIDSTVNIFPYIPYGAGSITYQVNLIGQTTDRVNLRAFPGNIVGPTTITVAYLNSSGATLKTTSTPVNFGDSHFIDSGRLLGIASIRITVTGQVKVDNFEFGKVP
jgi:hypothetical protein